MSQIVCKKCVMDKSAEEITFDENGVCNFCHMAEEELRNLGKLDLKSLVSRIKKEGRNKKYDCLIGLSGGVDSSYTLHEAVRLGLRPLCFSVDNGWQDPRADENMMRLVEGLKVHFYRYTINQKIFKDLQSAFMIAGQKNIEIPTDHILMATTYEMAAKYKIKWILSGGNVATESIMPASWGYQPRDIVHIKDIYKKIVGKDLKGLPLCSLLKWNYYKWIKGVKTAYLLDYVGYVREEAIKLLKDKYGYKPYGEKHCESTFTWWFQNFYLFEKFGIDKRKAHYSSLINSGQLTRKEAMDKLTASPIYPQLGFERKVMMYDKRPYTDFKTDEKLFNFISSIVKKLRWN